MTPRPGWLNMAIDLTLLERAVEEGSCILRVYRWQPFCLSFGRHEPVLRRYGRARIEALAVDCVRRPTGGRAVWHARELTYAVAAPDLFGSLAETYERVHRMFLAAVSDLGADARLAPSGRIPSPSDGACFATPVGGELLVDDRKVLGSAQLRNKGGLLQHGSLLLEDDQALVHTLAGMRAEVAPEAPLSALLGRSITFEEAAGSVTKAALTWTRDWRDLPIAPVLSRAEYHAPRFRSETWTWER